MHITQTQYTIADFCEAFKRGDITSNPKYQRSDRVWPAPARSFLIETILLGFPVPKIYLAQITDVSSKRTFKEIVDGQQRSAAIRDFYDGKLRLASTLDSDDMAGKTYDDLSPEQQKQFLDYALSADLFTGATPDKIVEVFRRMNSYTVPLNPEEQRHASYQGSFKWFIYGLCREFSESFRQMGTFTDKQIVRMQDAKLFTEISDALERGIRTTSKKNLDDLYKAYDPAFPNQERFGQSIREAMTLVLGWPALYSTALMKPYALYALLLAIIHVRTTMPALVSHDQDRAGIGLADESVVVANLSDLAVAAEESFNSPIPELRKAFAERTNVAQQRIERFRWVSKALTNNWT